MEWFICEYHIWAVDEVDYSLFCIVVILHKFFTILNQRTNVMGAFY